MLWIFLILFTLFLIGAQALTTYREAFYNKSSALLEEIQKSTKVFHILKKRPSLLFAIEIAETFVKLSTLIFAALFLIFLPISFWSSFSLGILLFAIFLFFGELLPRLMREKEKDGLFQRAFALFFLYLFMPISLLLVSIRGLLEKNRADEDESLEELKEILSTLLKSAKGNEKLDPIDQKLLESVIQFKDLIVKEIMVPRIHLFSLSAQTTIREASKRLAAEGYSRTPVYRDSLDNIIGLLLYKDILEIFMQCEEGSLDKSFLDNPIERIMKGVFYTPETKKVSHLLQEFRTKKKHMAIVVDEYGGTEGVVTIEDILEEIVGPISDEYDVGEEVQYVLDPKGAGWIVDARMNMKDAEDIFAIEIPKEGDYDTLAGFIFHRMEMIPPKGTKMSELTFDIEILSASERSVEKIRLIPKHPTES